MKQVLKIKHGTKLIKIAWTNGVETSQIKEEMHLLLGVPDNQRVVLLDSDECATPLDKSMNFDTEY